LSNSNIEIKTETLLEPIINDLGYSLYDVQFVKEGKDYYLRVTIDKESGISIEDCEKVSTNIDEVLDNADFIKTSYLLEVSSPGLERVLRKPWHFEKQIGNIINIRLFKPIDKKKEFEGILKSYNEKTLELEITPGVVMGVEACEIALAKLVCDTF